MGRGNRRKSPKLLLGVMAGAITLSAVVDGSVSGKANMLPGQISVDRENPAWLKYHRGGPFFMCGPGDPEGFLYRGRRSPNGTRDGDQMALIEKLKKTGANSIYLIAVRSHGGDGGPTENPFSDNDPSKGLNKSVLDQWETWFAAMDEGGIVIFFIFYDDGKTLDHPLWDTGDEVGIHERRFIETIVNRFEHHRNLIWVVKEEYREGYTRKRVSHIAAVIREADDHDHVIAVHQNHGTTFDFTEDPNIEQFAMQYNKQTAAELHTGVVTALRNAAGRYNVNMAEVAYGGMGRGIEARRKMWAIAMGGAYLMVNGWNIADTSASDLRDCGRLVEFMRGTRFSRMAPSDELAFGGTEYVLAEPGGSYIVYASALSGNLGLKGMRKGTYNVRWYDIPTGRIVEWRDVTISGGAHVWSKPAGISNELAAYIWKRGRDS